MDSPTPVDGSARPLPMSWVGWGIAGAAFLLALGACDVFNFDVGVHLLKGKWILENGSIPRPEDLTCVKRPGFAYQDRWLFQVGTWLTWSLGGWAGLTLAKVGVIMGTFACLWVAARPAGPLACIAATLAATLLMYERWDIRSELCAHLACAAVLALVGRSPRPDRAAWAAPPVIALAMNMHALSILAPALVSVAAVAGIIHTRKEHLRVWVGVAVLSWVAVLLNPQGWRLVAVPFEYLQRYRTGPDWYQGWITELQGVTDAVAFPSVSLRAPWIVVPFAALALAANARRIRALDAALLVLGALAAFSYRRNVAAAGPLLFPVIARNLHEAVAAWAASRPPESLRMPRL
ncbi:MAG: hypothetical protein HUU15_17015, partial [Candidatus Brocadiae bacterium]|nr:hypothetical protein [Candidatus Brocadiia bacterium]